MQIPSDRNAVAASRRLPTWLGLCLFLGIAGFFLWEEHRAHLLGAVPYVLLLLCPAVHLFMHRGHGSHSGHQMPAAGTRAGDQDKAS